MCTVGLFDGAWVAWTDWLLELGSNYRGLTWVPPAVADRRPRGVGGTNST
jgi:hypothetical protein